MRDPKFIDDIMQKLGELVPVQMQECKDDLLHNFKQVLQDTFSKMDLVTREEFDAQKAVLVQTRAKLDALDAEINSRNGEHN